MILSTYVQCSKTVNATASQTSKEEYTLIYPEIGSKLGLERKLRMWYVFHHTSLGRTDIEHVRTDLV